ncbi:MAG: GNAT family N-acetyltransferase [Hamadaea sp.]|nr:GNAT family N-acetyltransferase [Hamadaea sp.]
MTTVETTWDGLPIATDHPRGSGIVLRRPTGDGDELEFLLLHRHHHGPAYEGDWAWTSPSGARLPDEPVLVGAERELLEEAGLAGVPLRPVDLSGGWAVFAAQVPAGTAIVIDPEHDRFAWLSREAALPLILPESVHANFLKGSSVPLPELVFRPLDRSDFADLLRWQHTAHVREWWRDTPTDLAAMERKYGPRIDGATPVRVHVLLVDGRPAGHFQHYRTADFADYGAAVDDLEAVAIDYAIGAPDLIGRGIGTQAIWAYVRDVVLPAHPEAPRVVATPKVGNLPSIRALEKAGFQRVRDVVLPPSAGGHEEAVCVLDRRRIFG